MAHSVSGAAVAARAWCEEKEEQASFSRAEMVFYSFGARSLHDLKIHCGLWKRKVGTWLTGGLVGSTKNWIGSGSPRHIAWPRSSSISSRRPTTSLIRK
jgi:hypothetical protein